MTETTTEDALCPKCWHVHVDYWDEPCVSCGCDESARVQREARNALRAELRAGVAALPEWRVAEPGQVERAAVLDLIGEDES